MKKLNLYLAFLCALLASPQATIAAITFDWVIGYENGNGPKRTKTFTKISDTEYIIKDFSEFQGLTSETNEKKYYFFINYASEYYGHKDLWINPDINASTLTLTKYDFATVHYNFTGDNGKVKSYDIHWNPTTKEVSFTEYSPFYISGEFTKDNENDTNGWKFLDNWKFTKSNENDYTLTVPDNSWKAGKKFKVALSDGSLAWGNQYPIGVNKNAVTLTTQTGESSNTTMAADVPAGATVTFNFATRAFKVEFPVVAPNITVAQNEITGKTGDEEKQNGLTFDLIVKGSAPESLSALLKQNITSYNLTATGRFIDDKNGTEGTRLKYGAISAAPSNGKIVLENIPATADFNMTDVMLSNAFPGEDYTFELEMNFTNATMPKATAQGRVEAPAAVLAVNVPHFENTANVTMADIKKEGATEPELAEAVRKAREAVNYVATDGDITFSGLSSTVAWTPQFKVRYDASPSKESAASSAKKIVMTNLPYSGNGAGQTAYGFSVSTVYTYNNDDALTFATEFKKADDVHVNADDIHAPAIGDVKIKLYENYAERFYGLHSYWQDAFVTVTLDNSPIPDWDSTDQLCGALRMVEINGKTGVAPIEAGGNYAFANLSNEAVTALWYQPLPEGTDDCEHYKGKENSAPFFAGTGEASHDPRNQYFCNVDHFTDDASKGFGTINDWEKGNFFDGGITGDINAEATWYKMGAIYRKVHHINHEARYFGNGTQYADHSEWKFDFPDYKPMQAHIQYQYNMLTSDKYVSLTFEEPTAARSLQPSPRKITPAEDEWAPVYAGTPDGSEQQTLRFDNVTADDYFKLGTTTGIGAGIVMADGAPVEYYNLQGVKVDNPVPGCIYIFRQGSLTGKTIIPNPIK